MGTARNTGSLNPKHFRTLVFTVCLGLLLVGIGPFNRSARANGDEINFKAIDEYMTARMQSARIPGLALAIVKGDQVVYLKGYGRADPAGRPVTPQTSFLIGSVTKSFTALAVMQLVEAGQVELDAPVQQYLPWFRVADPKASAQITVRQLLNQTSGLPQPIEPQLWNDQDEGALERSVRVLQTVELDRPVGTFGYSNANYDTLGLIVQAVSGQSYEEYVKQHIFAPLDMQHSFVSQEEAMQHGMAVGHRWWFGIPVPITLPYHRAELPAGFIISSAEDMAHFVIAQMNGGRYRDVSVLSPEGIALMQTEPVPHTYGMGWESIQSNGRTLINHDGGYFNFQSSVFFDPEARVGVFVAANVMSALDAFSSPPSSSLTGPTTRAMAQSVLAMATNQPMPAQGPGNALLTLIFDLVILGLTILLIVSLVRLPRRHRRLAQHGIAGWSDLVWRSGLVALLHFAWPLLVLYLALNSPAWQVYAMLFQPDLGYWLQAVAVIVFLKGLLEIALIWEVFRQTPRNQAHHPTVVVLGAGFGGLWAARTLAEGPVEVILIDHHNYHTFFPLLYQVGAAELEPEDIAQPLRKVFWKHPNVHFHLGEVQEVDFSTKVVNVSGQEIHYDYLVIALGSQPNFYGIPGAAEYAFTLKSLEQGVLLRNQILTCFERAACEVDPELRQCWLTFTIVGGGPTGVEFAGALMELIQGSLERDFPELDFGQVRVLLLEALDHLLDGMPKSLSDYAQTRLEKMGVEVRLKSPLVKVSPDEVLLKDGTRIASKTVIWTAGVQGNIQGNQWGLPTNRRNQVEVLPTLQMASHAEVYVAGDLAGVLQEGRPLPMVAQVGIQTGSTAGRNILRHLANQSPLPFHYQDKGTLAVIGRNTAVAYIWGLSLRGFPAWVIWAGVHILNLIGFRNRLMVLINWAWAYLFSEHGVRLIAPSPASLEKEPAAKELAAKVDVPVRVNHYLKII